VWIPFAEPLAELVEALHVRQRRDFKLLLNAIRSIAIIHQAHRERDYKDRIIAEYRDYEMACDLLNDLLSEGIGAAISEATRETVAAVKALTEDAAPEKEHVPSKAVAEHLNLDPSAASRRINKALSDGYLVNLAEEGKRTKKLAVGGSLPEDVRLLPEPEKLAQEHLDEIVTNVCCTVARVFWGKGGETLFSQLMRTLVAQIVAPTSATKPARAHVQGRGDVRIFDKKYVSKPNTEIKDHEEYTSGEVIPFPPQKRATVQQSCTDHTSVTNLAPESAINGHVQEVVQSTSATKSNIGGYDQFLNETQTRINKALEDGWEVF